MTYFTQAWAFSSLWSAPISSAKPSVVGGPPIVTMQLSRYPFSPIILTAAAILSMVGVMRVLRQTTSAPSSFAVPAIVSGGTSLPRSCTMRPPAVSIVLTMFLPMSWTSP